MDEFTERMFNINQKRQTIKRLSTELSKSVAIENLLASKGYVFNQRVSTVVSGIGDDIKFKIVLADGTTFVFDILDVPHILWPDNLPVKFIRIKKGLPV